jgi:hypothetical protein
MTTKNITQTKKCNETGKAIYKAMSAAAKEE